MCSGDGQPPEQQATNPWGNFEVVGAGYFETLDILPQPGACNAGDTGDARRVAIISEAVARQTWPRQDPILPLDAPGEWQPHAPRATPARCFRKCALHCATCIRK